MSNNIETLDAFPLRSGTIQRRPLSPLLFDILLDVLISSIRPGENGINVGNEKVNQTLFANDLTALL